MVEKARPWNARDATMGEHEMDSAEQKALDSANTILNNMFAGKGTNRRTDYICFESPDQRMFCYTPWKDSGGDYWTWVMKPIGKGAKSGNATRWLNVGKAFRSRKRKTAKARAFRRYQNWLKDLEG